MLSKKVANPDK